MCNAIDVVLCTSSNVVLYRSVVQTLHWAIPVNKNTPLWRNVDCVRGGLSRPKYLSLGVIYMIDNNYVLGGEEEEIY